MGFCVYFTFAISFSLIIPNCAGEERLRHDIQLPFSISEVTFEVTSFTP